MSIACLVCLENYENGEDIVSINRCGHVYHQRCLDEWKKSQNTLSNCCPTCRTTYNKRSLTKLFLGSSEPERDFQKDIQKLEDEKKKENEEKIHYMNELIKIKTEYGVKCQAYNIIDTVNNEYLLENERLKELYKKMKEEMDQMKQQLIASKSNQASPQKSNTITTTTNLMKDKMVDLTSEEISDDDDIEIITMPAFKGPSSSSSSSSSNSSNNNNLVIEIDDEEDDDVQIVYENSANVKSDESSTTTLAQMNQHHSIQPLEVASDENNQENISSNVEKNNPEVKHEINLNQKNQQDDDHDDEAPDAKKLRLGHADDFKFLQDFLSQIPL